MNIGPEPNAEESASQLRSTARPMGFVDYELPDSFFDDLPEAQLAAWER